MNVDQAFIARIAYDLDDPLYLTPKHRMDAAGRHRLQDLLIESRGQHVTIRCVPHIPSAETSAKRLRARLGPDFIVTVGEHGYVSARTRTIGEPYRTRDGIHFDPDRWMTQHQAAHLAGLSTVWLRRLSDYGHVTRRAYGRRVLYRRSEVEHLRAVREAAKAEKAARQTQDPT